MKKGITLIELIVVIALIGVLALILYPMLTMGIKSYVIIKESSVYSQEALGFFSFLEHSLEEDITIVTAQLNGFSFTKGADNYEILVIDYPGIPPYKIGIKKNGQNDNFLIQGLEGAEFEYWDQFQSTTNITANIVAIQITLTLQGNTNNHTFRSAVSLKPKTEEIP